MNKKGIMDTILNWVFYRLPILIIIIVFFGLALIYHYNTGLNSHSIEYLVMANRIIYSPNLLAYRDPDTNRVYPGTIDLKKFDTAKLEGNLKNASERLAINLELSYLDKDNVTKAYINEKKAKIWDDYVAIGGYDLSVQKRYVKIKDNTGFHPGTLKIKVIIKK
jgi:hypothetical protein